MGDLTIAMIAPFGIRPKGTLSARMLPLARALTRRGHRVTIVAPPVQNPQDAGSRVSVDGVTLIHTGLVRLPGPAAALAQAALLLREALAPRPDILHLFKPKGYGGLAVLALPLAGWGQAFAPANPALVVDTDDWEGWGGWNDLLAYPGWAKRLFAWQERDLPRRAAAVTVVSRTLEWQVRGSGAAADRIFYLPNGTEVAALVGPPAAIEQRTGPPVVLLYTRFWEFQAPFLMAVLARLAARRPDLRLLVVGRGERGEERRMLELAGEQGLSSLIDYRGWVEPDAIPGLMAQADLALAPMDDTLINRARGLAKLLELMAAGLPIAASRVGQAAEYIEDNRSGLLARPGDPEALAQAALDLINDPTLRARLASGARARATLFSWDRLASDAERAYQRARDG